MGAGVTGFLALLLGRKKKKMVNVFLSEDFENFSTGWTVNLTGTGVAQRSAVQKVSGLYSAFLNCNAVSSVEIIRAVSFTTPFHLKFWVYPMAGTSITNVVITTAGSFLSSLLLSISSTAISDKKGLISALLTNQWNRVDAYYSGNMTEYFVNGIPKGVRESQNTNSIHSGITIQATEGDTANLYFDDVLIDDSSPSVRITEDTTTSVVADVGTRIRTVRHLNTLSPLIIG